MDRKLQFLIFCHQGDLSSLLAFVESISLENGEREQLVNTSDTCGWTGLHFAAHHGHPLVVTWMLADSGGRAAGFHTPLSPTRDGWTALRLAARKGNLACVQALVEGTKVDNGERKALLNAVDDDGITALHFAAFKGHASIIRWLLSDSGGRAAGFNGLLARKTLVGLLYEPLMHPPFINFSFTAREGSGRAAGFSDHLCTTKGPTALHLAAREGYLECVQALVEGSKIENGEREELINAIDENGWTVIHLASSNGHTSVIRWLLSDSGGRAAGFKSLLVKADDGATALHVACQGGHLECVQALVEGSKIENGEREALLNSVDNREWTALHFACYYGNKSIVRWLVSDAGGRAAGFNGLLAKTKQGLTALHITCQQGHVEIVQFLSEDTKIENGEREALLNAVDRRGWTALHFASDNGHLSLIRWLLSDSGGRAAGFKGVLAKTQGGRTALHLACKTASVECFKALVEGSKIDNGEREALINDVDDDGITVLNFAAFKANESIIRWLLSDSGGRAAGFNGLLAKSVNGQSAFHAACQEGLLENVKALVEGSKIDNGEREALINSVDKDCSTGLHFACFKGHTSIVQWLLSDSGGRAAGFNNLLAKTGFGLTVLHSACVKGHLECAQALVEGSKIDNGEREALLNAVSKNGSTALHLASFDGHTSVIQWILSDLGGRAAGFNSFLAKSVNGQSAFHVACYCGQLKCVQALVEGSKVENGEREALINDVDEKGQWTGLHIACNFGQTSIVKWLLSDSGGRAAGLHGSLTTTSAGTTALHVACRYGQLECAQALVEGSKIDNGEREALINAVDKQGWTSLHVASYHSHATIIRWLLSDSGGRAAGLWSSLAKSFDGASTMMLACQGGHLECVQALVEGSKEENGEREALMNAVNEDGWTALHYSSSSGQVSLIRWLVSDSGGRAAGFDGVLARTRVGLTTLHLACQEGHLECVQALVEGSNIDSGEREELINDIDEKGWTTLHYASSNGHSSIIRWLLSDAGGRAAGFNSLLGKTDAGATALHVACQHGHLECVQALVEGSKVDNGEQRELLNSAGEDGWTALHYADFTCRLSIVRWLLSDTGGRAACLKSSTITAKSTNSESVLHFASQHATRSILQALLSGCTSTERMNLFLCVDDKGWTVLHWAARHSRSQMLQLLLHRSETQMIVSARDHRGMTALHRAVIDGIDDESREEWLKDVDEEERDTKEAVVAALLYPGLSFDKIQDFIDDEDDNEEKKEARRERIQGAVSMIDPNQGLKFD